MRKETKSKVYKATVRPIMTYGLETKAETHTHTHKNSQMLEANQMKVLRKIVGKTKIGRKRSQQIRESCGIQPINEFAESRRREWDEHVTRMDEERLVKISWTIYLPEEDLQDVRKKDGAT